MPYKMTEETYKKKLKSNDAYLEKLEDIKIRVPRGYKDIIKKYAANKGTNINQLVITLINESMQRDGIDAQIPNGINSIKSASEQED